MHTKLLIRPPLTPDEGLRAYVSRVAHRNLSAWLFRPMLKSMPAVTAAVPEIAWLTTKFERALMARGSHVRGAWPQLDGIRFGNVILPRRVVRLVQRMVCPMCIEQDGTSRCVWELRAYDVCERHGLYLVDTCSACGCALSWKHASSEFCACGFPFANLVKRRARINRRRLCGVLADSMLSSISSGTVASEMTCAPALPIDWALLLLEIITTVLIPRFGKLHGLAKTRRFRAARLDLAAAMLEDQIYCDYLREAVFMYAAADPMTLVTVLQPGRRSVGKLGPADRWWDEVSFHRSLWDFKRKEQRRLAPEPSDDVASQPVDTEVLAEPEPRRAAIQLVPRHGPPPSWLLIEEQAPVAAARFA
jgi:hypothetical protein